MKKQMNLFITILVGLVILIGCGQTETPDTNTEGDSGDAVEITISTDNGEEVITNKSIVIEKDDILMDVLQENFQVEVNDGFITSIEGIEQNESEQLYWMYEVNDEPANVGANQFELSPGDAVVFDLHGYE